MCVGKVVTGWFITLVVAGTLTAAIYSLIIFSPADALFVSPNNCLAKLGRDIPQGETITFPVNTTVLFGVNGLFADNKVPP